MAIGTQIGKILGHRRVGKVAATLIAAPVQKDFFHAHTAHQLHGGVAVIRDQYVFGVHQAADRDANGFLAQGRRISADAPGALQGDSFLIEKGGSGPSADTDESAD